MKWLDYLVLVLFFAGMVAIAFFSRRKAKTSGEFIMAGKGLNGWMSAFAYGTTYFSAVIFIGYAGQFGQKFGLAAVWIGVFNALLGALAAWWLLAKPTKNMTTRLQVKTMPSFFEKRYNSKGLKMLSAVVVFVFLLPYGASVYNGLGALFEILFGINGYIVILIMAAITALYLCLGGYLATSLSDFVQGIIMLVGVLVMTALMLNYVNWGEGITTLSTTGHGLFITTSAPNTPWIFNSTATLIALIILTSIGVYGLPQTVHKYYTVRDKRAIKQGTIVSTAFALVVGFCAYFTGALGSLFEGKGNVDLTNTSTIIPEMIKLVIPAGLLGLIAVLILSASMSTLGSVSLSASSVVSVDLYKGFARPDADDKKVTLYTRIGCFVFIALATGLAILNSLYKMAAITSLMSLSWGTLSGCFIGPFVVGMRSRKVTKTAAYTSMIGTLVLTVVLILVFGYYANGWSCTFGAAIKSGVATSAQIGVCCMAYSVISTLLVSAFTKKPSEDLLYDCFDKPCDGVIA